MNTAIEQFKKEFYSYAESSGLDNDQWTIWEQDLERLFEKYKQMELELRPKPEYKRFTDEWGNSDWRDTGEMGG